MMENHLSQEYEEKDGPEILISVSQSIALQERVDQGDFATLDDAIAKSWDELQLTKVGDDWYSAAALERLDEGMRQADRGELIPGEEVMAKLTQWIKEAEARERTEL